MSWLEISLIKVLYGRAWRHMVRTTQKSLAGKNALFEILPFAIWKLSKTNQKKLRSGKATSTDNGVKLMGDKVDG